FFQAEDGIRDATVTGVQTCALPIYLGRPRGGRRRQDRRERTVGNRPRAVGFPLYAPDGLAFDGHHVGDPDRRLGSRPRAPRREESGREACRQGVCIAEGKWTVIRIE